jgi:hypothetical protein
LQFRYRGSRHESAVAQLFSLGGFTRMKIFISICCGVVPMYLALKFCPESLEPVVYWSLPLFHQIWHPWVSGPNPIACFWCLVLNAVIIAICVFSLLSLRKR